MSGLIFLIIDETDKVWRASFTARGIGARDIKNPGVRGSCCYFDVDGTKHCDDYVTQTYCTERSGNFEGIVPCNKNSDFGSIITDIPPSFNIIAFSFLIFS